MSEERNGSLIKQRFFNYDIECTALPNFFLMQTFNITCLCNDELNALNLPPIDRITIRNVTKMLKPIDKNYPFVFPIYGYVLITIGGTVMVVMIIGIVYYAKYHKARAMVQRTRNPPSIEAIELQTKPVCSREMVKPEDKVSGKVTPKLLQKKLEDLGVDFTPYEKYMIPYVVVFL